MLIHIYIVNPGLTLVLLPGPAAPDPGPAELQLRCFMGTCGSFGGPSPWMPMPILRACFASRAQLQRPRAGASWHVHALRKAPPAPGYAAPGRALRRACGAPALASAISGNRGGPRGPRPDCHIGTGNVVPDLFGLLIKMKCYFKVLG